MTYREQSDCHMQGIDDSESAGLKSERSYAFMKYSYDPQEVNEPCGLAREHNAVRRGTLAV